MADVIALLPEILLTATAVAVLLWDVLAPRPWRPAMRLLALGGVIAAAAALAAVGERPPAFGGTFVRDGLTQTWQMVALLATAAAVLLGSDYLRRLGLERGEYHALVLFAAVGAMVMAAARDLLLLFLGLETLSVPLYVLAAFRRGWLPSQEAGLKYFLLGSFASALFLYGVALLFGAAGSTALEAVAAAARSGVTALLAGGVALVTIGLAFKAALVPFHVWVPDVYEGSPLPVTAFMAVIAKVGAFAALLRTPGLEAPGLAPQWTALLAALAGATLLVGNLVALAQRSLKRLLAYSSIAHAGYLLMGVAAGPPGVGAATFYLAAYLFMTLGAFAVALLCHRAGEEVDHIEALRGVGRRYPAAGAAMALFMAALAGFPPTAGFIGKLYLFQASLQAGQVWLVLVGALTTVVSAYYYLRVPYVMFLDSPAGGVTVAAARGTTAVVLAAAAAVLLLGVFPGSLVESVRPLAALLGR
ncbi:MAG: NADH-quinone oxidoreductase subunit N [Armatimonadota bacterium]|nr:NADH-quinone oxidoreductase subunit N [Armatimonadota bacterium]MDR7449210.1 NADH-quinone oxidoreductase subunit N [Armatimonadota bacterium]MDR7460109.1 NADH-quinone oxidoreductase subunit N [Armatimonadota bacterium]MDR7479352.1 NADH-quinone oxidoreductase subunit N [Armatimonadota bacterium]MDR7489583.1 NADH-quinone oxidoreductase subunit N [Armatimonadota bacterium]